jgi:hypothetical protein
LRCSQASSFPFASQAPQQVPWQLSIAATFRLIFSPHFVNFISEKKKLKPTLVQ